MKKRIWIMIGAAAVLIAAGIAVFVLTRPSCDDSDVPTPAGVEELAVKPIIYLYPEEDTEVTVTLGRPEHITCAYPAYGDGWTVTAHPDGTLTDRKTGRNLYALYWEGTRDSASGMTGEGFVVKGSDSAAFLEEKLAILGLNEREAEEFIVYWLPLMEANEYNYIRFETAEEIEDNMPLSLSVQPDTVIRVRMEFKAVDGDFRVTEQSLETPQRTGFTVVEWGGTELD